MLLSGRETAKNIGIYIPTENIITIQAFSQA